MFYSQTLAHVLLLLVRGWTNEANLLDHPLFTNIVRGLDPINHKER